MKILKIKFLKDIKLETILTSTFDVWGFLSNKSNVKINCSKEEEIVLLFMIKDIDFPISYFWTEQFILCIPNDSFEILQELTEEDER